MKACVTHLADEADAAASAALYPAALEEATSAAGPQPSSSSTERSTSPIQGSGAGAGARAPTAREAGAAAARRRASRMRAHAAKFATALHSTSMEAWGLQRVLEKKRDPTTRALLDSAVRADRAAGLSAGAYSAYWDGLCGAVRGAVERTLVADGIELHSTGGGGYDSGRVPGGGGSAGSAALVAMYPFLRKAFLHLIRRLEESIRGGGGGGGKHVSGRGGEGVGGGGGGGTTAMATNGGMVSIPGGVPPWSRGATAGSGNGALGTGGVLGGSRWLALALEDEADTSSEDEHGDFAVILAPRAGEAEAGAEAGAGPIVRGNGGQSLGLRRGGSAGRGWVGAGKGLGGEVTSAEAAGASEGARLLEALGPLRDLFLARSLERLTTPVEQMFPQVYESCIVPPPRAPLFPACCYLYRVFPVFCARWACAVGV